MPYKIHKIIPYHLVGTFQVEDKHYKFHFMNSMPSVGNLYVYGAGSDGRITENVFVLTNLENRNFEPVNRKLEEFYKIRINDNVWELPTLVLKEMQYQVLISGTNEENNPSDEIRNINVYFVPQRKVVLNNGTVIVIHEDNINHFLKEIDNYNL